MGSNPSWYAFDVRSRRWHRAHDTVVKGGRILLALRHPCPRDWSISDLGWVHGLIYTPPKARFAIDSPLEEAGFEPLVPLVISAARAGQMTGNPCGARLGTTPFSERD